MCLYLTPKRTLKYSLRVIKVTSDVSRRGKVLFTVDESDSDEEKLTPMSCEAPAAKLRHGLDYDTRRGETNLLTALDTLLFHTPLSIIWLFSLILFGSPLSIFFAELCRLARRWELGAVRWEELPRPDTALPSPLDLLPVLAVPRLFGFELPQYTRHNLLSTIRLHTLRQLRLQWRPCSSEV